MPKRKPILYTPQNAAKNHFVELGGWCVSPIDEFFYGDFEHFERDLNEPVVNCTIKSGVVVPVEDWKRGKKMTGGMIRAIAEHFYLQGLIDGHRRKDIGWPVEEAKEESTFTGQL